MRKKWEVRKIKEGRKGAKAKGGGKNKMKREREGKKKLIRGKIINIIL